MDEKWAIGAYVLPVVPLWLALTLCDAGLRRRPIGWWLLASAISSLAGWIAAFQTAMNLGHSLPGWALGAIPGAIGAAVTAIGIVRFRRRLWPLAVMAAIGAASGSLIELGFYVMFAAWQAAFLLLQFAVGEGRGHG